MENLAYRKSVESILCPTEPINYTFRFKNTLWSRDTSNSKAKISVPNSVKFEQQSSKVDKLDAKIREPSIKSFKSDKFKSFDMFEASFKSSPVKKKPKMISDVQMAREESGNSRADPELRGGLSLGLAGN